MVRMKTDTTSRDPTNQREVFFLLPNPSGRRINEEAVSKGQAPRGVLVNMSAFGVCTALVSEPYRLWEASLSWSQGRMPTALSFVSVHLRGTEA